MVESINKQEKIVLRFIIKGSLGCTFVVLGARLCTANQRQSLQETF